MRIGVLLGGCGLYDGSDVFETVLVIQALEAAGERALLLAPDRMQTRTIDHLTGDVMPGEERNVLRESARLGRGRVQDLAAVPPDDVEALIVPGGYGPAVNLGGGFAEAGAARVLDPGVERFLRACLAAGKPVGLVGLGEIPVRLLLGQEVEAPASPADPSALRVDDRHRLVFTPGFAAFTRVADVRAGIDAMVERVLALLGRAA
jgi:enhancing lycopene biosynthesis protein 2